MSGGRRLKDKEMAHIELSIIIPTYNRFDYLRRCLESIKENTMANYEIIVVDGGSRDGTKEFLSAQSNIKTIFEGKLRGSNKATNEGFKKAQGEYVCYLNDDLVILDHALDKMIYFLKDNPKIGIGAFYFAEPKGRNALPNFRIHTVYGLPYANFGMLKTSLIREIGYLDERFVQKASDPDLSLRVWERGLVVVGNKDAKLLHFLVDDRRRKGAEEIVKKDNLLLAKKWESKVQKILLMIESNMEDYEETFWRYADESVKRDFLHYRGKIHERQGRFQKAEESYLQALEIDGAKIEILYNLASVYQHSGRIEKAVDVFSKVLQLDTDRKHQYWAGACYHLGMIYNEVKKDPSKAKKYFRRCLGWNPTHKRAKIEIQRLEV
jgi:GT2 family glycosyltransferase